MLRWKKVSKNTKKGFKRCKLLTVVKVLSAGQNNNLEKSKVKWDWAKFMGQQINNNQKREYKQNWNY